MTVQVERHEGAVQSPVAKVRRASEGGSGKVEAGNGGVRGLDSACGCGIFSGALSHPLPVGIQPGS